MGQGVCVAYTNIDTCAEPREKSCSVDMTVK